MNVLIVFLAGVVVVQGQTTNVQRCVSTTAQNAELPLNTYVEGCVEPPCLLPQLKDAVLHLVFRAPRTMTRMTTRVQAFILGPIPFPHDLQEQAVTCNYLTNSFCPVLEGEVLQYTLRMNILSIWFVGVSPTVEFRIEDDANVPFVCLRVPIIVTAPLNP